MAGKEYSKAVMVDSCEDQLIQFEVGLHFYDDPGRSWGDPELAYPPEFHKIDEEILEIYVCGKKVECAEMYEKISNYFDLEWVFEQAWNKVFL